MKLTRKTRRVGLKVAPDRLDEKLHYPQNIAGMFVDDDIAYMLCS